MKQNIAATGRWWARQENTAMTMSHDKNEMTQAPVDRTLDPLLDETLGLGSLPGGVPVGLVDRIVAATTPMLGRQPVLARIGWQRYAAAAVLALLCTALWYQLGSIASDAYQQVVLRSLERRVDHTTNRAVALVGEELPAKAVIAPEVNEEIHILADQLAEAEMDVAWNDAWIGLDKALLEAVESDL